MTPESVIPCDVAGSSATAPLSLSTLNSSDRKPVNVKSPDPAAFITKMGIHLVGPKETITLYSTLLIPILIAKQVGITILEYTNSAFSNSRSSLWLRPINRREILAGNWVRTLLIVLVMTMKFANAQPSFLNPVPGSTPKGEFQCYGLPIGALGFSSDLLTAYTTWCLLYLRRPLWPCKVKSRGPLGVLGALDIFFALAMLAGTFSLTIFTMVRCQNHWQYLLLAMQRLGISTFVSVTSLSATFATRPDANAINHRARCVGISGFTVAPALILGLVGYFSLLVGNWKNPAVQVAFWSIFGASAGVFLIIGCCLRLHGDRLGTVDVALSLTLGVNALSIVLADWMLGAIAEDISGIPAGKVAVLYWLYLGLKRLPMLWS